MKWISFSWMVNEVEWSLKREALLVAEMPETRQHFFYFSRFSYFLPVVVPLAALPAKEGEGALFS